MQALRLPPDLLGQNLYFNTIPHSVVLAPNLTKGADQGPGVCWNSYATSQGGFFSLLSRSKAVFTLLKMLRKATVQLF